MSEPEEPKLGPPRWFRVKVKPGLDGENEVWIQRRHWYFWAKDWYPVDNRRRFAAMKFVEAFRTMEEMSLLYDHAEKDVEDTLKNAREEYSMTTGASKYYLKPSVPREDALLDVTKEFKGLRKKFLGLMKPGSPRRLGTPENATLSRYVPAEILPHVRHEGDKYDHTIGFDRSRMQQNQGNQNRGKKPRNRNQQNQQNQQQDDELVIRLDHGKND